MELADVVIIPLFNNPKYEKANSKRKTSNTHHIIQIQTAAKGRFG